MISLSKRFALMILFMTGAILFPVTPVFADTALGWALIGSAPGLFIGYYTLWIGLVVVIIIEALIFCKLFRIGFVKALLISLAVNILSCVFLGIMASVYRPGHLNEIGYSVREAWMSRAKGALRSLGSSQLAYQDKNNMEHYGSYQALVDTMYIAEGYTLSNMIENYSMTWEVYKWEISYISDIPGRFR